MRLMAFISPYAQSLGGTLMAFISKSECYEPFFSTDLLGLGIKVIELTKPHKSRPVRV